MSAEAPNRLRTPLRRLFDATAGDWAQQLQAFAESEGGRSLCAAVDERVARGAVVYPEAVFRAFELTSLAATRVVILGQDPYHGPGQAEGLAFSVPPGQRVPPSLRNILAECRRDLGLPAPASGSLQRWAGQGVLLLNASLTVEDGRPGSHATLGWRALTDSIIQCLADGERPKVFMLWGAHAQAQASRIAAAGPAHRVLQCNHPSPLSARRGAAPFVGCGHFSAASRFLADAGGGGLDWALD